MVSKLETIKPRGKPGGKTIEKIDKFKTRGLNPEVEIGDKNSKS
jgi:hypothetical protein